ncbi:MAG TPA: glycosyltransferase family 39 protein [Pyrinomonadaceae bacterium]|nr:glycosyltransferase family 39 protein [Pyrinomonadaceae bacterium]
MLSINGQPSSMALGRSLFIFFNHALWRAAHALFQLPAENAYLLFKYAVIMECPLAVIACWTLARDLTRSLQAAAIAALLVATSPAYVIYSGQVMTEIPSLLLTALALILHLRGLRTGRVWMMLMGAALLGLGVNVREPVAFYAPWLLIAPFVCGPKTEQQRNIFFLIVAPCLVFLVCAFGPFILWFWTNAYGFRESWYGWRESMLMESSRHPVRAANVLPFLLYFFLAAPHVFLSLPFAFLKEWRERRIFSCLLMMGALGLWANVLLIFNYSTVVNWRYFLTGLPALAPLAGAWLLGWRREKLSHDTRRAFMQIVVTLMLSTVGLGIYAQVMSREFAEMRRLTRDYSARLALVPSDAVLIAGGQTVTVTYYRGIGMGRWEVIGTGGGWPGPALVPTIERYLQQGRRVFLDRDARWWSVCGWPLEETRAISTLESHFRFRRVSETIFEIRPMNDVTANDQPDLQSLLPENRPVDTKKCTRARRWIRDEK